MKKFNKSLKSAAIAVLMFAAIVGITYAATYIFSNPITVVITDKPPEPVVTLNTPTGTMFTNEIVTFTGTVTNVPTNTAVELVLEGTGTIVSSGVTDASGNFEIGWTPLSADTYVIVARIGV